MRTFEDWYESGHPGPGNTSGTFIALAVAAVLACGALSTKERLSSTPSPEYRIESVRGGAVQVVEQSTGKMIELRDQQMVKDALAGKLKRGDTIKY